VGWLRAIPDREMTVTLVIVFVLWLVGIIYFAAIR